MQTTRSPGKTFTLRLRLYQFVKQLKTRKRTVSWIPVTTNAAVATIATAETIAVQAAAVVDTTDRYLIARLGALCFLFSTIEYMIPKPLPFLRIGLANLPVMLAITLLPLRSFSLLVLIKVLGQALLGGTLFSWLFLFSLAGTLSSAAFMYSLKKLLRSRVSYIGLSVGGAFVSNASQLVLAKYLVFGESARLVAPPFLFMGVITGTILGMFANHFAAKSRWFAAVRDGTLTIGSLPELPAGTSSGKDLIRIPAALVLILILMFSPSLVVTAGITLLSVVLLVASTIRFRFLPPLLAVTGIVLFNLLVPFGRVLAEPFSLPITEGALLLGIKKALVLEGMLFLSRWGLHGIRHVPGLRSRTMADLFAFLEVLTDGRKKLDRKYLVESMDALMFERV